MKRKIPKRILTAVLSLALLLTMLPTASMAVRAEDSGSGSGETTSSGIELSKTATLENDGTYTINLEAYATGETTTITKESSVPLDIVLVIDQSGSMAYNDSGKSTNTESERRYYKLKTALNSFVSTIQQNAVSTGADYRIAIAGFASDNDAGKTNTVTGVGITSGSDSSKWVNTGLYINGTMTPYGTNGNNTNTSLTSTNYKDALVSANTNGAVTSSISTAITNMKFSGGTYTEYGLLMAQGVFENNSATYTYTDENGDTQTGTRKRIVILFTDGATNSSQNTVLGYSNTLKSTYGATVYCVGFGSSIGDFLTYISSNYGSDTKYSSSKYSGTSNNTTKYSMLASSTDELSKIFETISTDVSTDSTTVTLDENSVMKDVMGNGFTLTGNSKVTIKTIAGKSDGTTITWGSETTNSAKATISDDKTTVSVTGFNYAEKYISSGHEGEKLCVEITGVLPTESVTTDEAVNTNAATSGIYATPVAEEATATFKQPQTIITKKLYVLDYAKTATLSGLDQSSVTGIVGSYQNVSSSNISLTQSCGTSTLADNTTLNYTPATMQCNGYDSLYVFGQTSNETYKSYSANSNGNLWSKVSVIPANNVYYEDDFITTSTDGTTQTGTVGIKYSGNNDWTTVGTTGGNTETANGSTHGWEESLSNDTTYSDGSAHSSSTYGATATFTFNGTGVDIYGRTNMKSGKIYVRLVNNSDSSAKAQSLFVDELAVSNGETGYYQIPTASFSGLTYGNYTVTVTVMLGDDETGSYTYYLDGIRVYNPLGTVTDDGSDAGDAYKSDNELNAVFTEVRNILIDASNFTDGYSGAGGAVFIDNIPTENGTGETTTAIATYKDYGPKNEVYLATGQSIAFKVFGGDNYYLGLKAPSGSTTATVTKGIGTSNLSINGASDLYYEITPTSDGYIMVKNSGTNLLSITKLRSTSATSAESGIALLSADEVDEIMVYAASFDSLETVASTDTGVEEDSFDDSVTDADKDTGDVIEEVEEDDIVIDNPTEDTEEKPEETDNNKQQSDFSNRFNSIRNWFNGRR